MLWVPSEVMLKLKFMMDINGWHGLKPDLLKLTQETLNSKTKDVGLMDSLSNHLLITLMPSELSNS
jgi:hypothetical protein